jgi:hypothetical protein
MGQLGESFCSAGRRAILSEDPRAATGEHQATLDTEKAARKADKKAKKKAAREADERQRMMGARRRRK